MNAEKWFSRFAGGLLIIGSLLFAYGGVQHPRTTAAAMGSGAEEFFENFARTIHSAHDWQLIHTYILMGPILWALAAGAYAGHSVWGRLAKSALPIAAVSWAVTFVFDGFVAPVVVHTYSGNAAIEQLMVNQQVVIRMGLIAWLLMAVAVVASAGGLIAETSVGLRVIGALGLLVGGFPLIAWLTGEFLPGPFTSPYWGYSALATALWFLILGVRLIILPAIPPSPGAPTLRV
jgi:hypothetical protein